MLSRHTPSEPSPEEPPAAAKVPTEPYGEAVAWPPPEPGSPSADQDARALDRPRRAQQPQHTRQPQQRQRLQEPEQPEQPVSAATTDPGRTRARAAVVPARRTRYVRRAWWVAGTVCTLYATGLVLSLAGATPIAPRTLLPLPGVPATAPIGGGEGQAESGDGAAGRGGAAGSSDEEEADASPSATSASPSASAASAAAGDGTASPPSDGKSGRDLPQQPGGGPSASGPARNPTPTPP
ncbi:hypothetical protein, partial [Streptomyces sp. 8N616]|uniref:hypothetical protein n=1 Tax=Streptomyces sp. 8N616 TaxID=3457414 RepID=UPI003FD4B78E